MADPKSIPAALCEAAQKGDPLRGFTFVDENSEVFSSFESVAVTAARYAQAMRRLGLRRGDKVALALPKSEEFVCSFLGTMHAGLVPVPMYPPQGLGKLGFYLEHARHILRASESSILITSAQIKTVLGSLIGGTMRAIYTVEELSPDRIEAPVAKFSEEEPAFIQFTSGSTSRPKGVIVTHRNIMANTAFIANALKVTQNDIGCSWLPLYHDMGLIGFVLSPIRNFNSVVLMSPFVFLKRPVEWLRRITRHRATISFSPNFGYGLCASRGRDRDQESLDLSSWRIAGCGAEPIQMSTLERFYERFKSAGFRREALMPAYGLAENTLAVSFASIDQPAAFTRVKLKSLTADGFAVEAEAEDPSAIALVNCGPCLPGQELAIVNSDGAQCAPHQIGEIAVRGPAVMRGYYNDPAATAETIKNGWLHTGDMGFVIDGELFVCGRIKDLIIAAGRNYYPADIEWIASEVPGLRSGRVVAFSLNLSRRNGESEGVILCAESKTRRADRSALAERIRVHVLEHLGLRIDEVVLLERGSLPRTSSGKLQRIKTREMYLEGTLESAGRNEGKIALLGHLITSRWGFLRSRTINLVSKRRPEHNSQSPKSPSESAYS